jgi:hypothetical protein
MNILKNIKRLSYVCFILVIWEETSLHLVAKSMAAGLYCIVTNYGALYETGAEYSMYGTLL